ncbi:MAG: hypothetical protein HRT87_04260 [Legionellales bacterium]|nr:hypothetical protein [Legionellales bacterium]
MINFQEIKLVKSILIVFLFIQGCASTNNNKLGEMSYYDVQKSLVVGKTNKKKVKELLGEPNIFSIYSSNEEQWVYEAIVSKVKIADKPQIHFMTFVSPVGMEKKFTNKLKIDFNQHGILKKYLFSVIKN